MAVLRGFSKRSIERKRYTLRYDCWMDEGELLSDFSLLVSPVTELKPLTAEGAYVDPTYTQLTTFLAGGEPGITYVVTFIATTSLGQVKSDELQLRVT